MIVLSGTTQTLEALTAAALSTDYLVNYIDDDKPGGTYGSTPTNSTTATTTTILAAPGASVSRRVLSIVIRNRGVTTQTVTLKFDVSATEYRLTPEISLATGETAVIDSTGQLSLRDANGAEKVATTLGGDIAASGGFKHSIGPYFVTTAASQTDAALKLGDTAGQSFVAPAAGSVMAASAMIDTAVTGAGTSVIVKVFKNGSLLNAAFNLSFTQAGAEVAAYATAAKDTYTFVAGDKITVTYTSTAISNTPKVVAFVTLEF